MRLSGAVRGSAASPRVLLLAPPQSYRLHAYLEAAAALGVDLVVASQGEHSLIRAVADGIQIDLQAPDCALAAIVRAGRSAPFAAVVATDDATVELGSRAAAALGLAHNPLSAARAARRKDLARAALARAGVPVPSFTAIDLDRALGPQLVEIRYPCVVKPLALAASRGVIRADDRAQLEAACRRVEAIIADVAERIERRTLLVEAFIPGVEVAVEGLLDRGTLQVLATFDKPEPLDGPYFEESYYVTPSRVEVALGERVRRRVAEACEAYGLREGPIHAELRLHDGEAWIIEVAARTIGGDCARLLRFGTGRSLEQLVLEQALGRRPRLRANAGAAGVLMIPIPAGGTLRRVEGVLQARRVAGVEEVVIAVREGYELVPLPEGGSYLGFVFARGATPDEVEAALREAHACLNVVVAPAWRLEPGTFARSTRIRYEVPVPINEGSPLPSAGEGQGEGLLARREDPSP